MMASKLPISLNRAQVLCNLSEDDLLSDRRIVWFDETKRRMYDPCSNDYLPDKDRGQRLMQAFRRYNFCAERQVSKHSLPDGKTLYDLLNTLNCVHPRSEIMQVAAKKVLNWINAHVNDDELDEALSSTPDVTDANGAPAKCTSWTCVWRCYTNRWTGDYDVIQTGTGVPSDASNSDLDYREPIVRPWMSLRQCIFGLKCHLEDLSSLTVGGGTSTIAISGQDSKSDNLRSAMAMGQRLLEPTMTVPQSIGQSTREAELRIDLKKLKGEYDVLQSEHYATIARLTNELKRSLARVQTLEDRLKDQEVYRIEVGVPSPPPSPDREIHRSDVLPVTGHQRVRADLHPIEERAEPRSQQDSLSAMVGKQSSTALQRLIALKNRVGV